MGSATIVERRKRHKIANNCAAAPPPPTASSPAGFSPSTGVEGEFQVTHNAAPPLDRLWPHGVQEASRPRAPLLQTAPPPQATREDRMVALRKGMASERVTSPRRYPRQRLIRHQ